jgi:hypothetical protein
MNVLSLLIKIIHFGVAGYYIITPIVATDKNVLRDYLILSAFLWFHWITNNDTCALTVIESYLCGLEHSDTFFGQIIKPIYNFHLTSSQIYWIHSVLILVAAIKYFM